MSECALLKAAGTDQQNKLRRINSSLPLGLLLWLGCPLANNPDETPQAECTKQWVPCTAFEMHLKNEHIAREAATQKEIRRGGKDGRSFTEKDDGRAWRPSLDVEG